MNPPVMVCTGAAVGGWEALAQAWLLPGGARGQALHALSAAPLPAPVVCLVEHPVVAVAAALGDAPEADPDALVGAWSVSAQQMLRLRQAHPDQCVLLEAAQVASLPQVAGSLLAGRFGAGWTPPEAWSPPAPPDALRLAVAEAAVARNRRALALQQELLAACLPLAEDDAGLEPRAELRAAVARLVELETAAAQAPRAIERIEELRRLAQSLTQERDALRASLASAQQEGALAIDQLHRNQGTLEAEVDRHASEEAQLRQRVEEASATLAAVEAAARQREAEAARQRAELQAALELAQSELQALATERAGERDRIAQQAGELQQLQAESERLHTDQQALAVERDLLLQQLHQVQEELERYFIENERLAASGSGGVASDLQVERVQFGAPREEAPHRELPFKVHRAKVGGHEWPELGLRLLEHHGRAGLAVFAGADGRAPLAGWLPSGQEDGREYMLFIPSDTNTHRQLDALSATDWRLVKGLASWVGGALGEAAQGWAPRWRATAGRLALQVAGLPPRWRFDALAVGPSDGGVVSLTFDGVDVGHRRFDRVAMAWSTGRAGQAGWIELVLPEDGCPLLAAWPTDADGRLAARWRLRLGTGVPLAETRADWLSLEAGDRDAVRALLAVLPAATARAGALESQDLGPLAQSLLPRLDRALSSARWKRAARVLLGRGAA